MFAGIARSYDLNNRLHSFGRDQAWRRRAVALSGLKPGDRVLDVACGTGDLTECFALAGAGPCLGVDFTEPMLEIARSKARRLPVELRPSYRAGDAMALMLPDGAFDVVSIAFGIRNVSEPRTALKEFHRVLRPGGRLVILEFSRPSNRILQVCNDLYTKHLMPWTAGLLARDRVGAYRYLPRSVETFLDHRELAREVSAAGFSELSQELLTFGVVAVTVATRAP